MFYLLGCFFTDSPASSYPLSILGNFVFTWASRLHLIPSAGPDVELGGYGQLPAGTARAEAERRRCAVLNPNMMITTDTPHVQSHGPQSIGPTASQ
jgi:hypothetical protein